MEHLAPTEPAGAGLSTGDQIAAYRQSVPDYAQLLIDTSIDMIISVDLVLRIIEFNPAAEKCFGYRREEVIGRSVEMLYAEPREAWSVRLSAFGDGFCGEILNRRKNGEVFPAYLRSIRLRDPNGEVIGSMGFSRDITEDKRRDQELIEARRNAEAASQAKSIFVANMSHEIRAPLTAILGFSELLAEPDLSEPDLRSAAQTIQRNGAHLIEIVNNLLDLSKIESGRMDIEAVDCQPRAVVAETLDLMADRARAKGIGLHAQWRDGVPESIVTDVTRLRQALLNLVGNAIKFTHNGEVRMVVGPRNEAAGGEGLVEFEVRDTGIGMTHEQLTRLFEPFAQAEDSTTRRFGGTGLGLSISRHIARLLGGDLTVESRVGRGSVFRLAIPTRASARPGDGCRAVSGSAAAPGKTAIELPKGCRILVVEDGPDNQRLLRAILSRAGAEVTIVGTGGQAPGAVESARRAARPFNVILTDIDLPDIDGCDIARGLRAQGCRTPIIAITARAMTLERDRCLNAGCDDFLPKPLSRAKLLATIAKHTQDAAGRRAAETRPRVREGVGI